MRKMVIALTLAAAALGGANAESAVLADLEGSVAPYALDNTAFPEPAAVKTRMNTEKSADNKKVKCSVKSLADAEKCMGKIAAPNRRKPHTPQQCSYMVTSYFKALIFGQILRHPPNTVKWRRRILFVQFGHHGLIAGAWPHRSIMQRGPA